MASENEKALSNWIGWRRENYPSAEVDKSVAALRNTFSEDQLEKLMAFFRSWGFCITMQFSGELGDYVGALADFLDKTE